MNRKLKLAIALSTLVLSSVTLAAPNDRISLDSISMVSPGKDGSTSLSRLSKDKFYTITADLQNTNNQVVDYKITTVYALTPKGSVGDVISISGDQSATLMKDGDGYRGVLTKDKPVKLTFKNVKANNGPINKDQIQLNNLTSSQVGSGIEMRNIVAIEQADSGETSGVTN